MKSGIFVIDPAVVKAARRLAKRDGVTLSLLVEALLRVELANAGRQRKAA